MSGDSSQGSGSSGDPSGDPSDDPSLPSESSSESSEGEAYEDAYIGVGAEYVHDIVKEKVYFKRDPSRLPIPLDDYPLLKEVVEWLLNERCLVTKSEDGYWTFRSRAATATLDLNFKVWDSDMPGERNLFNFNLGFLLKYAELVVQNSCLHSTEKKSKQYLDDACVDVDDLLPYQQLIVRAKCDDVQWERENYEYYRRREAMELQLEEQQKQRRWEDQQRQEARELQLEEQQNQMRWEDQQREEEELQHWELHHEQEEEDLLQYVNGYYADCFETPPAVRGVRAVSAVSPASVREFEASPTDLNEHFLWEELVATDNNNDDNGGGDDDDNGGGDDDDNGGGDDDDDPPAEGQARPAPVPIQQPTSFNAPAPDLTDVQFVRNHCAATGDVDSWVLMVTTDILVTSLWSTIEEALPLFINLACYSDGMQRDAPNGCYRLTTNPVTVFLPKGKADDLVKAFNGVGYCPTIQPDNNPDTSRGRPFFKPFGNSIYVGNLKKVLQQMNCVAYISVAGLKAEYVSDEAVPSDGRRILDMVRDVYNEVLEQMPIPESVFGHELLDLSCSRVDVAAKVQDPWNEEYVRETTLYRSAQPRNSHEDLCYPSSKSSKEEGYFWYMNQQYGKFGNCGPGVGTPRITLDNPFPMMLDIDELLTTQHPELKRLHEELYDIFGLDKNACVPRLEHKHQMFQSLRTITVYHTWGAHASRLNNHNKKRLEEGGVLFKDSAKVGYLYNSGVGTINFVLEHQSDLFKEKMFGPRMEFNFCDPNFPCEIIPHLKMRLQQDGSAFINSFLAPFGLEPVTTTGKEVWENAEGD